MKRLKLRKNTYFWNEFWDFIFLPVEPGRTRERIFKSGSKRYAELASKRGWEKLPKGAWF
jgi:hypothetical protein